MSKTGESSTKKRKASEASSSSSSSSSTPSRSSAAAATTTTFVFQYVDNPQAYLINDALPSVLKENLPYHLFRHPEKKRQKMIAGRAGKLEFIGSSFGEGAGASPLNSFLVAMPTERRDGQGRVIVELVDAAVFGLEAAIVGIDSEQIERQRTAKSYQAKKELGEAFGTAKEKAMLRAAARNEVDVQQLRSLAPLIRSGVDQVISTQPALELSEIADEDRAIPPFNLQATTPDLIYPFDAVITPVEQNEIQYQSYLKMTPEDLEQINEEENLPPYLYKLLEIQANKKKKEVKKLITIFYLLYLIRFKKTGKKDLGDENRLSESLVNAPYSVQERFISLFTESFSEHDHIKRVISAKNEDKLLSYIFVLCLHAEDFSFNYSQICTDLKITKTRAAALLRNLGCKIIKKVGTSSEVVTEDAEDEEASETPKTPTKPKKGQEERIARLTAPLEFPKLRNFKRM